MGWYKGLGSILAMFVATGAKLESKNLFSMGSMCPEVGTVGQSNSCKHKLRVWEGG